MINEFFNALLIKVRLAVLDSDQLIVPKNKDELIQLINHNIKKHGNSCNLNHIDVSHITDMSFLFCNKEFHGDISGWDTSIVMDMKFMFCSSKFNNDISKWNVSNVQDMRYMFASSKFNSDISQWTVSNVRNMQYLFNSSEFNSDISKWDVSQVEDMELMFYGSKLMEISDWKPYRLKKIDNIFSGLGGHLGFWIELPYWAQYKDQQIRNKAIDAYHLHNSLENQLVQKNTLCRKIKI